ncbi:M60 family metallopeptidase [Streptomyces luteireticuli]|uniref:Peptidase M60 domain-containing protein n=1 Tax=Streptomyces luteireticuli TaxID=173858 RepID=A0ABN0YZ18_9ACTN
MTSDNSPEKQSRSVVGGRTALIAATVLAAVVGTTAATTMEAVAAPGADRQGGPVSTAADPASGATAQAGSTRTGFLAKAFTLSAKPSPAAERKRLKSVFQLSSSQSTGLYAKASSRIAVGVDDTPDSRAGKVELRVGVPGAEGGQHIIGLKPGVNTYRVPVGGMLYLSVEGDSSSAPTTVRLGGGGVMEVPRFVLGTTGNDEFRRMLDRQTAAPWVEYVGERTILTVDRATALKYRGQDQRWLMENYETIALAQDAVNKVGPGGRTSPSPLVQHITLDGRAKKGTARAEDGHVAFGPAYARVLLSPKKLQFDDKAWKVWLELGRQRQLQPVSGEGLGEATASLYATAVERHFDHPFRTPAPLKPSRMLAKLREANPKSVDVRRAVMLDQLRLAHGNDFWPKVNNLTLNDRPIAPRTHQDTLVVTAGVIAGADLRDFFAKAGISVGPFGQKNLDSLDLRKPGTDPSTLGYGTPE